MECTLNLTDGCNFHCSYCYEGKKKHFTVMNEEILRESIKYIIENNNDNFISLTFLGGEPLLNKEMLYKAIEIIEQEYPEHKKLMHYRITTNGVFLTEDVIKFLVGHKFHISISIDGDRETHNLNRVSNNGEDVYNLIFDNMKNLMTYTDDFKVRMTVTGNTVDKIVRNVKYFYDFGIKNIHVGIDKGYQWSKEELRCLDRQLEFLREYYLREVINDDKKILGTFDYKITTFIAKREVEFCSGGTSGHIVINGNGELYPCGYVLNEAAWDLGNVKTGLKSKKFFETIRSHVKENKKCQNCKIAFTCSGRKCGFLNYLQTGYMNISVEALCMEQKILYRHNYYVMKQLYQKKHPRLMKMLELADKYSIELSDVMKEIMSDAGEV